MEGCDYEVIENWWDVYYWSYYNHEPRSALNILLRIMASSTSIDLAEGCRNRLIILLRHGYDFESVETPTYLRLCVRLWQGPITRYDEMLRSPSETAEYLGEKCSKIWYDILSEAGITAQEISNLRDSQVYIGISQLFSQTREAMSRDESIAKHKEEFMEHLVTG